MPGDPYNRTFDPSTSQIAFMNGGVWGLYVDDEQSDQCAIVASDLARGWHHVIAGDAPGQWPGDRCPGAINALEWYPYGGPMTGAPISPPRSSAYILQWSFKWPGSPPPTALQRKRLLRAAEATHPKLILLY